MWPIVQRLILIVSLVLVSATTVAAKDWRGILPLHSTRADVEALLGPPPPASENGYKSDKVRSFYFLEEGQVHITFTDKESTSLSYCLTTYPDGTVTMIRVTPRNELSLADLNLDEKKFRRFDPDDKDFKGFINEEEGLVITVFKGKVKELVYLPSAVDRSRCSSYYVNLENLVSVPVCGLPATKFDEYGDLPFSDEKARLDNFAIQLASQQNSVGYLMVYAGKKAVVGEALLRANRARDYLLNVRKLDPEKFKTIDGGHHEELTIQLFIAPRGMSPPKPMPTVDPSQVEIVYQKKPRSRKKRG